MSAVTPIFRSRAFLRLASFSAFLCLGVTAGSAAPLDPMPGLPVLPVVPGLGFIFNLTGAPAGVQDGSPFPGPLGFPGPDFPVTGGICISLLGGEICPTLEPGLLPGMRDWEVEIGNYNAGGPALAILNARFIAPGLNVVDSFMIPSGKGVYVDFAYPGPTKPNISIFSGLPFPIDVATSITDPPGVVPTEACVGIVSGCSIGTSTSAPEITFIIGVPEPTTFALLGAGLLMVGVWKSRFRRAP